MVSGLNILDGCVALNGDRARAMLANIVSAEKYGRLFPRDGVASSLN